MVKKKQAKNTFQIFPIVIIIVVIAVVVLLYVMQSSLHRMQTDVYNVKQSLKTQNELSQVLVEKQLVVEEEKAVAIKDFYENKELGLSFSYLRDSDLPAGAVWRDDLLLFGNYELLDTAQVFQYTLRIYKQTNLEQYQEMVRFVGENCLSEEKCLLFDADYKNFASERSEAMKKIFSSVDNFDFDVWQVTLPSDCLVPTYIVFNEKTNTLYEFQEKCEQGVTQVDFANLKVIIESLVFSN